MANGNASGPHPAIIMIALFLWFLLCWVLPVVRLRDEKTTANMKTVWSGWLIIAGMGPIFYGIYTVYNSRGNAASNTTGGNAPPLEPGTFLVKPNGGKPNANATLPSNAVGATLPPPEAALK